MQQKFLVLLVCAALSAAFHGCGGPPTIELKLAASSGTVTLDGNPLPKATIVFHPEGGEKTATGQTDENGKFTMTTTEPGDGAIVGKHKVTVVPQSEAGAEGADLTAESYEPPDPNKKPAGGIPARYASAATSGLEAEVKAGENNSFEFKLTSE